MESKVRKGIGLVAHDAMKKDLIEWVLWNSELLMGNKFYCTGTTGTLILKALKEKHPDEEWDFTILKSGPLGGDQQMGSRIVDGQIDFDRIIAENARKNMCRTDLEKTEVVAPEGSHYLDGFQNLPIQDYSSRNEEDRQYIIVAKGEKGNIKIRFTPDERLLDQMKTKSRSKIKDE